VKTYFLKKIVLPGLLIQTEFGKLLISPGEVAVLQLGFRFSISLPDGPSRGYVAEVFDGHFHLPELGLIGASSFSMHAYILQKQLKIVERCSVAYLH
jgi:homogentisate 1,2-dioxygenase